ncbi:hypothetical protein SAMN05421858_4380 [Haladaptatus litoreus]|uniref:Alcohol dehydrogenase n=1 Tax=Haladaptatus litoreus TaxID=553468 RepID=A0A1N7ELL5_9EURY|nr:hypothetical protein SAMN05421858_4380 [Haladaptatus litoreus]
MLPLEEVAKAYEMVEGGRLTNKVVLDITGE